MRSAHVAPASAIVLLVVAACGDKAGLPDKLIEDPRAYEYAPCTPRPDQADGKPTFLKLKLTLELPDHETADTLDADMPRLQDVFQTFLRELRPEDLAGSEGTLQLRVELQRRVNLVIAPSKINAVLIEEMLIN